MKLLLAVILLALGSWLTPHPVRADWPMPGHNIGRTSWGTDEIKGLLTGDWAIPIEPYVPQKVQVVAAENKIFLSTAKGLYAFDADDGQQLWVYPTSMPLGHSPTYVNGFLYLAGFDRKIHKIDAVTGVGVWTFTAGGGFAINPLVVNGVVYAGSRDGYVYAVTDNGSTASLLWQFDTGAPVAQSAAYADGTVYVGADNLYAYALNAATGVQVWRSEKLPGLAMNSWWPVVNGNSVYFTVTINFAGKLMSTERDALYGGQTLPSGTPYGNITYPAGGHLSMDTAKLQEYLNTNPGRRTLVVLDRSNGSEITPYVPALWGGMTGSLTRFPPIVDNHGTLYFRNHVYYDDAIPGGMVTGWHEGDQVIQIVGNREAGGWGDYPIDEPGALSGGGDTIYHTHCCARVITSYDSSVKNTIPLNNGLLPVVNATATNPRQWRAENWKIPGYDSQFSRFFLSPILTTNGGGTTPSLAHADNNPPVPYNGRVYVHRGNALIALSPTGTQQLKPTAGSPDLPAQTTRSPAKLHALLQNEIQKMVAAGHLRPGVYTTGLQDNNLKEVEPYFLDLYHNPSETYIVLLRALPLLSPALQNQVRTYLQNEWNGGYTATNVIHSGFNTGTPRESHLPLESRNGFPTKKSGTGLINYYASWKYAQEFGNATTIFSALPPLPAPLAATVYDQYPQKLNEYITGYYGYIQLAKMTGNSWSNQQATLATLIAMRQQNWQFQPPNPLTGAGYYNYYVAPIALNFMYLEPEFASDLNAGGAAEAVITAYETAFPYWFVAKGTEMHGEGAMQPPHYYHGLFQAKAWILKQGYQELEPYLDAPAYAVGDLYYIDNLVSALNVAGAVPTLIPTPSADLDHDGDADFVDYRLFLPSFGTLFDIFDFNRLVRFQFL